MDGLMMNYSVNEYKRIENRILDWLEISILGDRSKKKGKYWSSNWGSTNWAKEGRPF